MSAPITGATTIDQLALELGLLGALLTVAVRPGGEWGATIGSASSSSRVGYGTGATIAEAVNGALADYRAKVAEGFRPNAKGRP